MQCKQPQAARKQLSITTPGLSVHSAGETLPGTARSRGACRRGAPLRIYSRTRTPAFLGALAVRKARETVALNDYKAFEGAGGNQETQPLDTSGTPLGAPRPDSDTQKKPPRPSEAQLPSSARPAARQQRRSPPLRPPAAPASSPPCLGSDAACPAPAARSAAAAAAGGPAGGGGGGRGRGKMADGVDHIDIYADVGEEFNQVREGRSPRRRSGRRCGPDATWGLPQAASRRGCRPCASAARGPCRPTPARRPPGPPFYRVVSRAAGGAACRGAQSADAGRSAAASGSSLAAVSLPIVGGRRGALPAALGPDSGAACVAGRTGRRRAPSPVAGRGGSPARRAPSAACDPAPPLGLRFLSSLHFVSLSEHGRLMEGRIHRPLYPARPVSWARLAFATGFGVALSSSLSLSDGGLGAGTFATSPLTFGPVDRVKSRCTGRASVVEGLRCVGGPAVLGLFGENA